MEQEMTHEQAMRRLVDLAEELIFLYRMRCAIDRKEPSYDDFCSYLDRTPSRASGKSDEILKAYYQMTQPR